MVKWDKFAETSPALAAKGQALLFQYGPGLAFLATVRKAGGPRVHPVCPVISHSRLYLLVMPDSPKKWDLMRDGKFALQSFPEDRPDSDEFYLSSLALPIDDESIFNAVITDAKHQASRDEILFELTIDRAMHTRWEGFGTPDLRPVHMKWNDDTPILPDG